MKIINFWAGQARHLGVVAGNEVVDIQAIDGSLPTDLGEWLRRDGGSLAALDAVAKRAGTSARRRLADLTYAMPVATTPGKIICLGLNYMDHVKEGSYASNVPKYPTVFFRCLTSLTAHMSPLICPRISETFDYEAELLAVVGKRAKHLTLANALDCIAGYSCANEGTIREFQRHTTQWDMGKNFDQTGSLGPWFVSADELPPGGKGLKIESRLNGKVMQSDNTENMMFPLAETLVYLTQGITLEPGDLILTGTPSGVGHPRKPPVWMKDGDVFEVEIEGIGILRNPIQIDRT